MAALHFPAEIPGDAIRTLTGEIIARRFTSAEAVDAALYVGGCANAFRQDNTPGPFGEAAPAASIQSDDELVAAAEELEARTPEAFGDDSDAAGAFPWQLVLPLVMSIIERWLSRR